MGEIVDLEKYRKQRKRRTSDSAAGHNRRARRGGEPKEAPARPVIETFEAGSAEPERATKVERNEPKPD
jgi:hypothetical protein